MDASCFTGGSRSEPPARFRSLGAAAAALALAGCAAAVNHGPKSAIVHLNPAQAKHVALRITGPHGGAADWESFKGEWRAAFQQATARIGATYEALEGRRGPEEHAGTLVTVTVHDYRYLTAGARHGFGIMTGNAYINATASFADIASGAALGSASYNTSSTAWEGVFSAMTDKQVAAIADAITKDLVSGSAASRPAAALPIASNAPEAAPASPHGSARPIGQESHQVERMLEVKACNAAPVAALVGKGPGQETYSIACTNGETLAVRCEFGACRVLR